MPVSSVWNICTLDDPSQDLANCRKQLDPAAAGARGKAAAALADGLLLGWQGDLNQAIEKFSGAIEVTPRATLPYLNRGIAYQRQRDFARAAADFDMAVRHGNSDARTFYLRSLLRRERGDTRGAASDRDRAIELDSRFDASPQ